MIACAALAGLAVAGGGLALALLAVIGACYGATISICPAIIAKRYGDEGPAVYGRVFIAWGVAGLSGPWLAGALFDAQGDYALALWLAAGFAAISLIAVPTSSPAVVLEPCMDGARGAKAFR